MDPSFWATPVLGEGVTSKVTRLLVGLAGFVTPRVIAPGTSA